MTQSEVIYTRTKKAERLLTFLCIQRAIVFDVQVREYTMHMDTGLLASFRRTKDANDRNLRSFIVILTTEPILVRKRRVKCRRSCLIVVDAVQTNLKGFHQVVSRKHPKSESATCRRLPSCVNASDSNAMLFLAEYVCMWSSQYVGQGLKVDGELETRIFRPTGAKAWSHDPRYFIYSSLSSALVLERRTYPAPPKIIPSLNAPCSPTQHVAKTYGRSV